MPTYDYICTACSNAWELEQRIVEDPIKICPKCGASTAKRQISSGAGFILKGGGWYADGYGSAKSGASSSDEGSKSAKTDATAPAAEPAKKSEAASSTAAPAPAPAATPATKPSAA